MDSGDDKDYTALDFATGGNYHWAGSTYRKLGGSTDSYNPRVPVHLDGVNRAKAFKSKKSGDNSPDGAAQTQVLPSLRGQGGAWCSRDSSPAKTVSFKTTRVSNLTPRFLAGEPLPF